MVILFSVLASRRHRDKLKEDHCERKENKKCIFLVPFGAHFSVFWSRLPRFSSCNGTFFCISNQAPWIISCAHYIRVAPRKQPLSRAPHRFSLCAISPVFSLLGGDSPLVSCLTPSASYTPLEFLPNSRCALLF